MLAMMDEIVQLIMDAKSHLKSRNYSKARSMLSKAKVKALRAGHQPTSEVVMALSKAQQAVDTQVPASARQAMIQAERTAKSIGEPRTRSLETVRRAVRASVKQRLLDYRFQEAERYKYKRVKFRGDKQADAVAAAQQLYAIASMHGYRVLRQGSTVKFRGEGIDEKTLDEYVDRVYKDYYDKGVMAEYHPESQHDITARLAGHVPESKSYDEYMRELKV